MQLILSFLLVFPILSNNQKVTNLCDSLKYGNYMQKFAGLRLVLIQQKCFNSAKRMSSVFYSHTLNTAPNYGSTETGANDYMVKYWYLLHKHLNQ
jgi:hypothetical protein